MASEPNKRERETAQKLAAEVRRSMGGRRRTWRKVGTLLRYFDLHRLTPDVRVRLGKALDDAGLEVDPPLSEVLRSGTVRLTPRAVAVGVGGTTPGPGSQARPEQPTDDAITARFWSRPPVAPEGAPATRCAVRSGGPGDGRPGEVAWYDIDITTGSPKEVFRCLTAACPGLTLEMVEDLFQIDENPGVKEWGKIRKVTAIAARPWPQVAHKARGAVFPKTPSEWIQREGDEEDPDDARIQKDEAERRQLAFWLVELLANRDWLLSAWHVGQIEPPTGEYCEPKPMTMAMFVPALEPRWVNEDFDSAEDLGLLLLHQLALGYGDALRAALDELPASNSEQDDERDLDDMRHLIRYFRPQLIEHDRSGISPDRAWFETKSKAGKERAAQIHALISTSLSGLDATRAAIAERAGAIERKRTDRFQTLIAGAGGVVLVPTLVASIYGANTELPGEGNWSGFFILLALLVASAVLTILAVRRWDAKQRRSSSARTRG